MNSSQRRMDIYEILLKDKKVEVNALADHFQVSTMTIRRDLLMFEKQGLVTTSYGGAYLNQQTTTEASFSLKSTQMIEEKNLIGLTASQLVEDGDTIIVDSGSTALLFAKHLQNKKLTVITNSWPLVNFLGNNNKIELILAPGRYNDLSAGAISAVTACFFRSVNADKAFISTQGFDFERGLSVPDMTDAEVKHCMTMAGRKRYLMIDHSKLHQTFMSKHGAITDFDHIIIDDRLSDEDKTRLTKTGVDIIYAR